MSATTGVKHGMSILRNINSLVAIPWFFKVALNVAAYSSL